jgi:Uma2 family endonuclease
MRSTLPRCHLEYAYKKAEIDYLRSLPPEHFMESTSQSRQREITLASLALVRAKRPDFQLFSELLVQYPLAGTTRFGQVVPDNMIVIHPEPSSAEGSFNYGLEPGRPFCVMEYVSPTNMRKDYEDNMHRYETEMRVPYYLLFYPDAQDLQLHRYNKAQRRFVRVNLNKKGRLPIRKLELEVALLDGWVRYWYQGELLPLPDELQAKLDETKTLLAKAQHQLDQTQGRLDETETKLDQAKSRLEQEKKARQAAELENARLKAELAKRQNGK